MNPTTLFTLLVRLLRPANLITGLCALALITTWPATAWSQNGQDRVRKSVDDLSEQELDNYIHAISMLKKKAEADPNSKDGFAYYAALHDGFQLGPCEHGQDTFMPWHRALLWLFEEALRRSDPPRTSNVTIPYWDWSELPSGDRFPKVFETKMYKGAPNPLNTLWPKLFRVSREKGRICRVVCQPGTEPPPGCDCLPWPRWWLEKNVMNNIRWEGEGNFAGKNFSDRDCSKFSRGAFGKLELDPHNSIHDTYVGGNMADPSTAGEDPLFWSFHTYIDLLFAQWQDKGNKVDTCLNCEFCGLYKQTNPTAIRYKVEDVLDIRQMGYSYEYKPQIPLAGPAAASAPKRRATAQKTYFEPHPSADFALSGKIAPAVVRSENITIPSPGFGDAKLRLSGIKTSTSFSYQGNVYLYPAGVAFTPRSRIFRSRFLVELFTIWKTHTDTQAGDHGTHAQEQSTEVDVDLNDELKSLARSEAGKTWIVTVVLVPNNKGKTPMLGKKALAEGKAMANALNFESMKLEIK